MRLKDASVLLVDDEPDLLEIMAEWFRREGATVFVAENGAEALSLLQTNHVDAVVSDIRMPVMDGIALLRSIKSTHTYKPSVMFITGFTDIAPREAYDMGVEALMFKPVERTQLILAVARILTARDELWRSPPTHQPKAVLVATFESLAAALRQRHLAFGRGGFCIYSTQQLAEDPVDLFLDFQADHRKVTGQGIVRWTDLAEAQLGVEITHLDDASHPWILSLTAPNRSLSFIPRSTQAESVRAFKASP